MLFQIRVNNEDDLGLSPIGYTQFNIEILRQCKSVGRLFKLNLNKHFLGIFIRF